MVGSLTLDRRVLAGEVTQVAIQLLGALVCCEGAGPGDESVIVRVTEVEAYGGSDDPASHAFRGPTPRNAVMAGPPGHAYVYFSYGMHWCLNVTAGLEGRSSAVLIRAGEVLAGAATAKARRPGVSARDLARGPGRLCRTLGVGERHRGVDLCAAGSELRLLQAGPATDVERGPRVGVSKAADRPWRFWIAGEPTVSGYRRSPRADPLPDSPGEQ